MTKNSFRTFVLPAVLPVLLSLLLTGCPNDEGDASDARKAKAKAAASELRKFEAPTAQKVDLAGLSEKQQAALVNRVEEKWRAMERRDFAAVYEYTTPNYRKVFSKHMFLNKFGHGIQWQLTGVDVLNYDAEAAVASVGVRVMSGPTTQTLSVHGSGVIADTVKEQWLLIDGEWWNNAK